MSKTLSFQEIILRLTEYWQAQGCVVQQPYNVQVGAGTYNPATTLRVLGPEPWNVVYVEPSVRPDDGRFGENPNRMQMHHQLQVILKPDPGNPQELYLKSLEAIGIDPRKHDIRFVEDNWESPALGAWGLGWEVWLDGQEITQFTYFQQSGSLNLEPVSVEITYGLDRITLALQNKRSVWEIDYGGGLPYGDVLLQSEIEHCHYYFEVADVDAIQATYDTYEREAQRCIDAGLVAPAHDYNLKCSHLFNVMDTRGAVGVTERANYFKRMRGIARQVAKLYVAQREKLDYPLKKYAPWQKKVTISATASASVKNSATGASDGSAQTFLLEIGSEELPAADLTAALAQLRVAVPAMLKKARLRYESVTVDGAPRRLVVMVHGLAASQPNEESEVKGPPAARAVDADGNWTKAALGFARGKGIDVADLKVSEVGGKRWVTAVVRREGQRAVDVLAAALPSLISGLRFGRSMRWNETKIAYSRPLRWFTALFGAQVVPFCYAGVASGRTSRGLRSYDSPAIAVGSANDYPSALSDNHIMWRVDERRGLVERVSAELAASVGGSIPADSGLLAEIVNLVEYPTPFLGKFEERYLALPAEILVAVMRKHQRYFPVYGENGQLLPYFVGVRNGDGEHLDTVTDGNEQVIRARFSDAEFFYKNDKNKTLVEMLPELDKLTFQADLGSMLDKVKRLEKLTPILAGMLELSAEDKVTAARAAALSKADLAMTMVVEMTSLQGIMGGHYATLSGESAAVAAAIAEQYEAVSKTPAGMALALADRLDSLVGLNAAGLLPKGSNDPFALRRAAIQIVENIISNEKTLDLREAVAATAQFTPMTVDEKVYAQALAFIGGRLEGILRERGLRASVIKAVMAAQSHDPYNALRTAQALEVAMAGEGWPELLDAYARCVRMTRKLPEQLTLRADDFKLDEEKGLYAVYAVSAEHKDGTIDTFLADLATMQPAITHFFDNVLVMDKDEAVRDNRLALLQHVAALADGIADLSQLEGF